MLDWINSQILCPHCLNCGSMFVGPSFFCQHCEESFLKEIYFRRYRTISEDQIYSLFEWKNDPKLVSKQIISLLKSPLSKASWFFYSQKLIETCSHLPKTRQDVVIVPIPGSSYFSFHTSFFAQALSRQLKIPILPLLLKPLDLDHNGEQKKKNKIERSEVLIRIDEKFTKEIQNLKTIILIDDIVTTGSTFKATIRELRQFTSPDVELFSLCLFSRAIKAKGKENEDFL